MVIVLMGVAGSGKSTVGRLLAAQLHWAFHEGDDHHPPANVRKMQRGVALDDADRRAWLDSIRTLLEGLLAERRDTVVACSALRRSHRERLALPGVRFVYLKGDPALIRERLSKRKGHFFDPSLLASQLEALEEPDDALVVDIRELADAIAQRLRESLTL